MLPLRHRGRHFGFTFIELVMTLAILSVLVLMATPAATIAVQQSNERELKRALLAIREALDAYKRAADQGRIDVRPGESGYPRSLTELAEGVVDNRSPQRQRIYFLRRVPRDPFNQDRRLPGADTWGLRSYASSPDAPEPGDDVYDVYSRAEGTGLNGIPYKKW